VNYGQNQILSNAPQRKVVGQVCRLSPYLFHICISDIEYVIVEEMSNRDISYGGKGGWCVGLTTLQHVYADCLEILGTLTLRNIRASPGL
jgi:hypothetical protein